MYFLNELFIVYDNLRLKNFCLLKFNIWFLFFVVYDFRFDFYIIYVVYDFRFDLLL